MITKILPGSRGLPDQITVYDQPAHSGGEGSIYFTPDNKYVVKIYHHPSLDKPKLLHHILTLGSSLGEDDQYLAWPLGIIHQVNGRESVGVVTRRVPTTYQALSKF